MIRDAILERLAIASCGKHTPRVVEIGPGRGALTRHLLPHTDDLHAIELDASLARYLIAKFGSEAKLHIHEADVLTTDLTQWGAAVVTGNLPYYITSPTLEKFLALDERFPVAVFVIQWEVAERILARPGTRAFGYFTVATQLVCDVELVCEIPPSAFAPPPKVDSAAVRFTRKTQIPGNLPDVLQFAARCFAHKRKTLRNNLRPFYAAAAGEFPEATLRAEQLTVRQFIELHAALSNRVKASLLLYTETS